ncbi:MAG: NAD+ synthase, partial [Planctomycetaceae bacterium]|nr:NAD+ synthase [Planctomycetaceae bacterium]
MRIGVAQLNPTIGDLHHNCTRILQAARECAAQGAELLVCPELALCGYPPKDLLLRSGFVSACDRALDQLAEQLPKELGVLIGHPTHRGCPAGQSANAASLLEAGEITHTLHKTLLPNYDVFDERRYFRPASDVSPIEFRGRTLGVHICEDAWYGQPDTFYHERTPCEFDPVESLINQGAEYLINLSASPFEVDKLARRHSLMARHSQSGNIPSLFVNQVGGNDDLVFDGGSFVLDRSGKLVLQLPQYESVVRTFHWDEGFAEGSEWTSPVRAAQLLEALTLGLRDYAWKTGFRKCVLGLS